MRVILLCAGYATRLYPLTKDRPKPLLPVGDRSILEWILEKVKEVSGIEEVFIVTNARFAGQFEEWKKDFRYPWPLTVVNDGTTSNENRLGAIGDLRFVLSRHQIDAEDLLVIAGDNYFDFDLKSFLSFSESKRPSPVLAVYDVHDYELARQYGLVKTDPDGKILEFFEKPANPTTTLASCGLYWLPAEASVFLDRYLSSGNNPDQPGHYMRWLAQHAGLYAVSLKGRWLDIGDRCSYDKANQLFRESPR